ncbi:MAG: methyl-accepting chemotaxis protein [Thioalkalispiraceae bacterium]|jgi:methyl-accepting chemotaxis protein
MAWFNNLSFRFKLMIPLGVLAALIIFMALTALTIITNLGETTQEVAKTDIEALDNLLQADRDLYQALVAERSMIFVDVESEQFNKLTASHGENVQQARDRIGKFMQIASDAGFAESQDMLPLFESYTQKRDQWEALTNKIVQQRASNTRSGRNTAIEMSFGNSAKAFTAMRDIIDMLTEKMKARVEVTQKASEEEVTTSIFEMSILVLVAVVLCGFMAFIFPSLITRPMRQLIGHVNDIAEGEGDLTARLDVNSRDEMGQLAEAFNRFITNLHEIISHVADSSTQVSNSSEELSQSSQQTSEIVSRQRNETEQVAAAINEMAATVQEVANSASEAANAADQADREASDGRQVVMQTIEAIGNLASDVERSSQVINRLKGESENIGSVLDVIKGIAEQTNLLALNAAIEAARAGEQGRGFAVVADEVRTLAQRTQESTQEIEQMIEALQVGANEAESVMSESRERAESTVEQAGQAGHSLESITQSVATIRDMNTQIATASEQQSSVANELNRSVTTIHQVSEESEQQSNSMLYACNELAQMGEQLQTVVGRFKI